MGWLIALVVLVAIGCIPVGVFARYDAGGCVVRVVVGGFRYTVFPFPKRKRKKKKESSPDKSQMPEEAPDEPKGQSEQPPPREQPGTPAAEPPQTGGSIRDFFPLVRLGLDFLNHFRRKLRMDDLNLKITLAGDDPCDLAVNYGRAWEALGNLLPRLERAFHIGKRNCQVQCDFTAAKTTIEAQVKLTLYLRQIMYMGIVYGFLFLKEFLSFRKKRKGGSAL